MPNDQETYKFMYKCRYCGEKFCSAYTGPTIGMRCLLLFINSEPNERGNQIPFKLNSDLTLHSADDHVGIADFIGCKIEKENKDD